MEFKLNEYRQGVTDEELLSNVRQVADLVGDSYLSYRLYRTSGGKYGENTFRGRFSSWSNVLNRLELRTEKSDSEMKRISDETMIADLKRVSELLNTNVVTSPEYSKYGKFSYPTIAVRFGNWAAFISKADLEPTGHIRNTSDKDLFLEIERIWIALGKQPTTTEMKKGISKYSLDTFMRRFGGWRNALVAFLEYVNADGDDEQPVENPVPLLIVAPRSLDRPSVELKFSPKRTTRNINLKLRFTVLQRDCFRCCSCGASPAKNPEIELHIDHIIPWSKGGETELENLQTLCSKCNLGKSNHAFV